MNDFEELDFECFPTLKSALELDGLTVKDLLKRFSAQQYDFCSKTKQGWIEQFTYSGLILTVLIHGESKQFAWKEVCKWAFHPSTNLSESDFEIWLKQKSELTK